MQQKKPDYFYKYECYLVEIFAIRKDTKRAEYFRSQVARRKATINE